MAGRCSSRSVAFVAAVAMVLAACGAATPASSPSPTRAAATAAPAASSAAPTAAAAPTTPGPVAPLTIAVFNVSPGFAHVYVAQNEGYFKQSGVDVTVLDGTAANTLNLVVAGTADLGNIGIGTALLPVSQGKETSVIFAHAGNANGGFLVAGKSFTSLSQLKRVGASAVGTSAYGYCSYYKSSQKLTYDLVPFQDVATQKAALVSGQIDGACNSVPTFQDLMDKGQVNVLIDTRDPAVRKKYVGEDYPEAGIFGLTENLAKKRESLNRFMKAIGLAEKFVASSSDDAVAASIRKSTAFQTQTQAALAGLVAAQRPYYAPNHGYISEGVWKFSVAQYQLWGLPDVDPAKAAYSYQRRVDMSFYEAGIGKPAN